ncbi:family 2 encapsulin nanocompartment cargo protein polyprenyl transferase [Pseudonocardia eucalypti]|uniref:Family 2 encapsulin nanocompartment cargo protein polyprenyl transferase n=1 Tax=Pseudonocardia eucalypti TaxID=648755 RepID=A0ABP9QCH1_9PSEU
MTGSAGAIHIRDRMSGLCSLVLPELRAVANELPERLRDVAGYHFGWYDDHGRPTIGDPGKLVRPTLTLLSARAAGGMVEHALPAALTVELVHNFSLLHDDVMDGGTVRRHRRTVWSAFGTADAILLGDALLVLAFKSLARLGQTNSATLCDTLLEMVYGQSLDLAFEKEEGITADDALAVAAGKTGALMGYACYLGALSAGTDGRRAEHFRQFGENLGIAFQLVDDILGLWGDPEAIGKPVHTDLQARKKTLPVVAALAGGTVAAGRFATRYRGRARFSAGECAELSTLIEDAGGRAAAERRARRAFADAVDALDLARPVPEAHAELLALADVLTRPDDRR